MNRDLPGYLVSQAPGASVSDLGPILELFAGWNSGANPADEASPSRNPS